RALLERSRLLGEQPPSVCPGRAEVRKLVRQCQPRAFESEQSDGAGRNRLPGLPAPGKGPGGRQRESVRGHTAPILRLAGRTGPPSGEPGPPSQTASPGAACPEGDGSKCGSAVAPGSRASGGHSGQRYFQPVSLDGSQSVGPG